MKPLQSPITLPCGTVLTNRIAKSAMNESLADLKYAPTPLLTQAYKRWAEGGAGLLISGNIMVDSRAIGEMANVVVESTRDMAMLRQWASSVQGTPAQLWAQINHPGRQAAPIGSKLLVAPSAIAVNYTGRRKAPGAIPRELTEEEILDIIHRFGNTAAIMREAGFQGVQIHGAHGYLVSQFLSGRTNVRTDAWGGSLENRSRFVMEIYREIRKKIGTDFPVGIKLNSSDFQKGGFSEEESMQIVRQLSDAGMDLLEISGGTYEAPAMMGARRDSTKAREAYFLEYAAKVRQTATVPLMVTGGFRTAQAMQEAIESGALDVVGLARPFALYPDLPNQIFNGTSQSFEVRNPQSKSVLSSMVHMLWYEKQIQLLGKNKLPDHNLKNWKVMAEYLFEMTKRSVWRHKG